MSVWEALLFMVIGGAIAEVFEIHAWRRYRQGKDEGERGWQRWGIR